MGTSLEVGIAENRQSRTPTAEFAPGVGVLVLLSLPWLCPEWKSADVVGNTPKFGRSWPKAEIALNGETVRS
jgi:hypothetical protein